MAWFLPSPVLGLGLQAQSMDGLRAISLAHNPCTIFAPGAPAFVSNPFSCFKYSQPKLFQKRGLMHVFPLFNKLPSHFSLLHVHIFLLCLHFNSFYHVCFEICIFPYLHINSQISKNDVLIPKLPKIMF